MGLSGFAAHPAIRFESPWIYELSYQQHLGGLLYTSKYGLNATAPTTYSIYCQAKPKLPR